MSVREFLEYHGLKADDLINAEIGERPGRQKVRVDTDAKLSYIKGTILKIKVSWHPEKP